MPSAAAITAIGATHGRQLVPAKVFDARPSMPAAAINPYLINKIAFLQGFIFAVQR